MRSFWSQIIIKTTLQKPHKKTAGKEKYSAYELAKGHRDFLITLKRHL